MPGFGLRKITQDISSTSPSCTNTIYNRAAAQMHAAAAADGLMSHLLTSSSGSSDGGATTDVFAYSSWNGTHPAAAAIAGTRGGHSGSSMRHNSPSSGFSGSPGVLKRLATEKQHSSSSRGATAAAAAAATFGTGVHASGMNRRTIWAPTGAAAGGGGSYAGAGVVGGLGESGRRPAAGAAAGAAVVAPEGALARASNCAEFGLGMLGVWRVQLEGWWVGEQADACTTQASSGLMQGECSLGGAALSAGKVSCVSGFGKALVLEGPCMC